jgi:hypothetical protein
LRWQTSDSMLYRCIDQYYYHTGITTNVINTYVNGIQVLISHQHQWIIKLIYQYKKAINSVKIKVWVSEWLLFNANSAIFQLYKKREQVNVQRDDDEVRFVLNQHSELDLYSASTLKQQFASRHVAPLGYIILIRSQPVFALSP